MCKRSTAAQYNSMNFNIKELSKKGIDIVSDFTLSPAFKNFLSSGIVSKNIHSYVKMLLRYSSLFQLPIYVRPVLPHMLQPKQQYDNRMDEEKDTRIQLFLVNYSSH